MPPCRIFIAIPAKEGQTYLCRDPRIPLNEHQAALLTARAQGGITRMANPKILICDDEEGIRESLKLILADHYESGGG